MSRRELMRKPDGESKLGKWDQKLKMGRKRHKENGKKEDTRRWQSNRLHGAESKTRDDKIIKMVWE